MAKRVINVPMTYDRLQHLGELYNRAYNWLLPENEHEDLLRTHIDELRHRMNVMLAREQNTYSLSLTLTEQCAFQQVWRMIPLEHPYDQIVINAIIEKIDKEFHNRQTTSIGKANQR